MRVTIAALSAGVAVAAVGLLTLRSATKVGAASIFSFALLGLAASTTGALLRRGRQRATWLGALIFGGGYLLAAFNPWSAKPAGNAAPAAGDDKVRHGLLLTDHGLAALFRVVRPPTRFQPGDSPLLLRGSDSYRINRVISRRGSGYVIRSDASNGPEDDEWVDGLRLSESSQAFEHFLAAGHSLVALSLGLVGAAIGRRIYPQHPADRAGLDPAIDPHQPPPKPSVSQ